MPDPTGCVFCAILAGEAPATIVRTWATAIAIKPLNPVTEGHTLIIPATHVRDVAEDPEVSAMTMEAAAEYAAGVGPCNVITSVGREATQSVFHLHIHVVPRREGDGLALPWTPNAGQERAEKAEREAEQRRLNYNAANAMMGVHKRRADRLKAELEHAKGALAGDSEAMAAFMADHAKVVERRREQCDMWQRAAEQAEAAIDRVHALAHRLKAEVEQGLQSAVLDSQTTSWKTSAHTADLFLAALDTDPGCKPASPRHTGREEVPHVEP